VITPREQFVNRLAKDFPEMNVMWMDKSVKPEKKWSSEKILKDLSKEEKEQFNLRKQLPNEIILDIEEKYKAEDVIKQLQEKKLSYEEWDTGSRGIHISIKFSNLAEQSLILRNRIRKYIINLYGCDESLAKESQWMALEHSPHFKTGKAKTLIDSVNQLIPNIIESEIIDYCVKDLEEREKRKVENKTISNDFITKDPYFNYVITHTIENGDRNNILFKNFAIALVQSGLTRDEIEEQAKKVIEHCPGKTLGEFMGWVDKAHSKEISEYNKDELRKWSLAYGYPMLYPTDSDEDLLNLLTIKQLWDIIWDNKIKCQDIWRDLCYYNMLGTIIDEREEDYRIHVIFSSYSGTGKDEGVNLIQDVLERLQFKTRRPAEVTDRTLVGAVNQARIEYNVKYGLSPETPEVKGKLYQDPVEVGWLSDTNWMAFSESEVILKPSIHNRHIQVILRQAMDKARRVEKGVAGKDVYLTTNTSFIFTTYKMDNTINAILHNGLFQRTLYYDKNLTDEEDEQILEHVSKSRFNNEFRVKYNETKYMGKLLEKLRLMKKWYIENKKNIVFEKDMDKLVLNLWREAKKDYKFLLYVDKMVLDSMTRRMGDILYRLIVLNTTSDMKLQANLSDTRKCFKIILDCLESTRGMVLSQDKGKKKIYGVLFLINQEGSLPKSVLHTELEKKFKMKSTTTRCDFIKQLVSAEYVTTYQDGKYDILTLTDKGRNYLAYEE
jgi:DNA-binding MarR family transcriptional regulator